MILWCDIKLPTKGTEHHSNVFHSAGISVSLNLDAYENPAEFVKESMKDDEVEQIIRMWDNIISLIWLLFAPGNAT